ncbi:hypothetical protein SGPA1_30295 [Streptomyces misionensis JCM 4497]
MGLLGPLGRGLPECRAVRGGPGRRRTGGHPPQPPRLGPLGGRPPRRGRRLRRTRAAPRHGRRRHRPAGLGVLLPRLAAERGRRRRARDRRPPARQGTVRPGRRHQGPPPRGHRRHQPAGEGGPRAGGRRDPPGGPGRPRRPPQPRAHPVERTRHQRPDRQLPGGLRPSRTRPLGGRGRRPASHPRAVRRPRFPHARRRGPPQPGPRPRPPRGGRRGRRRVPCRPRAGRPHPAGHGGRGPRGPERPRPRRTAPGGAGPAQGTAPLIHPFTPCHPPPVPSDHGSTGGDPGR